MGTSVEVMAMADCMPFYGITDLREILTAVKDRNAQTLQQCRPLKVTHYLEVGNSSGTEVPLHSQTQPQTKTNCLYFRHIKFHH